MKCDICGVREAAVFIRQITRSATTEVHYCEECARQKGVTARKAGAFASLSDFVAGLIDGSGEKKAGTICASCGLTLEELKRTRRAGCPCCYEIFRSEILALMRGSGMEARYPRAAEELDGGYSNSFLTEREYLKRELSRAVENEDYEIAAHYRDRLSALEREGETPG